MPPYLRTTFLKPTSANKTGRMKRKKYPTKFQNINWQQQVKSRLAFCQVIFLSHGWPCKPDVEYITKFFFYYYLFLSHLFAHDSTEEKWSTEEQNKISKRKNKTENKKKISQGQILCLSLYGNTPIHCGLMKTWTFFGGVFVYVVLYFIAFIYLFISLFA